MVLELVDSFVICEANSVSMVRLNSCSLFSLPRIDWDDTTHDLIYNFISLVSVIERIDGVC